MKPLLLSPIYKSSLWGGAALKRRIKRGLDHTSESWELSDRQADQCLIEKGEFIGWTLNRLLSAFSRELIGYPSSYQRFPLLMKLINAQQKLSIQVHPNEKTSKIVGGEPKTEAWYVLHADPGAKVYVGWNQAVSKALIKEALFRKKIPELLCSYSVNSGDMIYLPGGLVHAIGEGCLIYEVQQNSDTTFRLYDWERVDAHGIPRPLHINEAMDAMHYLPLNSPFVPANQGIHCPFFQFKEILSCEYKHQKTFDCLFPITGNLILSFQGSSWVIPQFRTAILPANLDQIDTISPSSVKCLLVRLNVSQE